MAEQNEAMEAIKNCAECKKVISKAKRYYRNGAYYCNKNCYKKQMGTAAAAANSSEEK